MIKCKNCGSGTRFDIDKQCLVCDYCDSTFNVLDYNRADIRSEEQKMDAIVHTCPQCGAELYTTDDTAATFCSYCGSSVLLESRMTQVNMPEYIIPFQVTREAAEEAYKKKLRKALFAPKSIKEAEIKQMRPIYMPYWEYYLKSNPTFMFQYEAGSNVKGSYQYTDINMFRMEAEIECDGLEYDASAKLPDDISKSYAPFYFKEAKLFNPAYMSGFYADLGDLPAENYQNEAIEVLKKAASKEICSKNGLHAYSITPDKLVKKIDVNFVESGLAMYPVWFACAQDKTGRYVNYAAVNGQSGKVAADLPIDKKRILIGSLILAIPIFLLLYTLFTPSPVSTLVTVAILSIIGSIIGFWKASKINIDDLANNNPVKASGNLHNKKTLSRAKWGIGIRLLAGLLICILMILFRPVHDYYYYSGAILSGIMCGWTYWNLFELHNRAIERPLPQLDKRGGEE